MYGYGFGYSCFEIFGSPDRMCTILVETLFYLQIIKFISFFSIIVAFHKIFPFSTYTFIYYDSTRRIREKNSVCNKCPFSLPSAYEDCGPNILTALSNYKSLAIEQLEKNVCTNGLPWVNPYLPTNPHIKRHKQHYYTILHSMKTWLWQIIKFSYLLARCCVCAFSPYQLFFSIRSHFNKMIYLFHQSFISNINP